VNSVSRDHAASREGTGYGKGGGIWLVIPLLVSVCADNITGIFGFHWVFFFSLMAFHRNFT
jgi:hypothetical protein